jgi:dynein light chain LC8-type
MGEELKEWANMWGARVRYPNDMPDDLLRDAIETSRRILDGCTDFETQALGAAAKIKEEFDTRWSPHWHVIIGRSFGSFVTHETKCFVFFYLEDKGVMLFKHSL